MAAMFRWRPLYLTDTTFEIMSMIGSFILIAMMFNNAILMTDLANCLCAAGKWRYAALVEARPTAFGRF